jgi:hypothetical protein
VLLVALLLLPPGGAIVALNRVLQRVVRGVIVALNRVP